MQLEYPKDALHPNKTFEASLEQLQDHVFLKNLTVYLTFLERRDEASDEASAQALRRLAEALHTCHFLQHLEFQVYIPSANYCGDPASAISAFLLSFDCEALESLSFRFRRLVVGIEEIPFHEFLLRHRGLKSFSLGGSNSSSRLPELPNQLLDAICALPCLTDLRLCAIGREGGSSSVNQLVKAVMASDTSGLQTLDMKRQHPVDWDCIHSSPMWDVQRRSIKWATLIRNAKAGAKLGPISVEGSRRFTTLAIEPGHGDARVVLPSTPTPKVVITQQIPPPPLPAPSENPEEVSMSNVVGEVSMSTVSMARASAEITGKCFVCLDAPRQVIFSPCNHRICCKECLRRVEECPLCSSPIQNGVVIPDEEVTPIPAPFGQLRNPLDPPRLL